MSKAKDHDNILQTQFNMVRKQLLLTFLQAELNQGRTSILGQVGGLYEASPPHAPPHRLPPQGLPCWVKRDTSRRLPLRRWLHCEHGARIGPPYRRGTAIRLDADTVCGRTWVWTESYVQVRNTWSLSKAWRASEGDEPEGLHPPGPERGPCIEICSAEAEVAMKRKELQLSRREEVGGPCLCKELSRLTSESRMRYGHAAILRGSSPSAGWF